MKNIQVLWMWTWLCKGNGKSKAVLVLGTEVMQYWQINYCYLNPEMQCCGVMNKRRQQISPRHQKSPEWTARHRSLRCFPKLLLASKLKKLRILWDSNIEKSFRMTAQHCKVLGRENDSYHIWISLKLATVFTKMKSLGPPPWNTSTLFDIN